MTVANVMLHQPLVSIVTVSFNQAEFLEECLGSVLSQTYPNIQYIVIDGGSRDGSVDIIKAVSSRLSYWHSRRDTGAPDALNQGFGYANGEIYAYLNSDDVLLPNTVERWVDVLSQRQNTDAVYGDIEIIDGKGVPACLPGRRVTVFRAPTWSRRSMAAGAVVVPQQACAWRREVHVAVGGFNEENRTCWDGEFFHRASMLGYRFTRIPQVLGRFRVHSGSISGTDRLREYYAHDRARIRKMWDAAGVSVSPLESRMRKMILSAERFFRSPRSVRLFP